MTLPRWVLTVVISLTPYLILSERLSIACTPLWTALSMPPIMLSISRVDLAAWSARRRISFATTLKPRPYSPAFLASIVAFRESKLV